MKGWSDPTLNHSRAGFRQINFKYLGIFKHRRQLCALSLSSRGLETDAVQQSL